MFGKKNNLDKLVNYFLELGNFDHFDVEQMRELAKSWGVAEIDAGKAFFIARERATLRDTELLDGGKGLTTSRIKNYGESSLHQMLFENDVSKK